MQAPLSTSAEATQAVLRSQPRWNNHLAYLQRIAEVYLRPGKGPLAFWYERPEKNDRAFDTPRIGEYYMTFRGKAAYPGPFDEAGIPLLDYRGDIGRQYNPIAIAQYGLAQFNHFRRHGDIGARDRFLNVANWLVDHLEVNAAGLRVWHHHFTWRYREPLVAPWYSGLAQGQGLSVLTRAAELTGRASYLAAGAAAFKVFLHGTRHGGVIDLDADGDLWIEEYIVHPASHILNGFVWGLWGVFDYARVSGDVDAWAVFNRAVRTLQRKLTQYDTGFWSLYELRPSGVRMLASPYYHQLHTVQLRVLARLTGREWFNEMAARWDTYTQNPAHRARALASKLWFKFTKY